MTDAVNPPPDYNEQSDDQVNHPKHYNEHPSGVECIDIVRHMTFNVGNVFKYLWRAGLKDREPSIKDHKKALFYLQDEIARLEGEADIEAMKPTAEEIAEAAAREAVEADRARRSRRWANAAKTAELLKEGPGLSNAREETNRSVAAAVNYAKHHYGLQGTGWVATESLGMITVVRYDDFFRVGDEINLEGSRDETVAEFLARVKRFFPPELCSKDWRLFPYRYRPEFSQKSGYFAMSARLGEISSFTYGHPRIYLGAIG